MATRKVFFHIGLHKTGTTSIQMFLHRTRRGLRKRGVDFYDGMHRHGNHEELPSAAIRPGRDTAFTRSGRRRSILIVDDPYRQRVAARVRDFIAASPCQRVLFSCEDLSILRYPDEMERLRAMVPAGDIRIIVYLRDAQAYLASYKLQIAKGRHDAAESIDRDGFNYTEPDTWLIDFDDRVARFRQAFGEVTVIDYDAELARRGNVIPSFLEAVGVDPAFRCHVWRTIFRNRTLSRRSASP
jgi:hypothetical protein